MGELPADGADDASRTHSKSVPPAALRKNQVGGPMTLEEVRLNRGLLEEIHKAKKAEQALVNSGATPPRQGRKEPS